MSRTIETASGLGSGGGGGVGGANPWSVGVGDLPTPTNYWTKKPNPNNNQNGSYVQFETEAGLNYQQMWDLVKQFSPLSSQQARTIDASLGWQTGVAPVTFNNQAGLAFQNTALYFYNIPRWVCIEVKAYNGTLDLNMFNRQLQREINYIKLNEADTRRQHPWIPADIQPVFFLVTTANTIIGNDVIEECRNRHIQLWHRIAYYDPATLQIGFFPINVKVGNPGFAAGQFKFGYFFLHQFNVGPMRDFHINNYTLDQETIDP